MAQINVIGYVTQDIVLRKSQKGNAYVRFVLKEHIGDSRFHTYLVCTWGNNISRLQRLKIKKGSLIWVTGSLELIDSPVTDGQRKARMLKIYCSDFGIIPVNPAANLPAKSRNAESEANHSPIELDGDRDQLPE